MGRLEKRIQQFIIPYDYIFRILLGKYRIKVPKHMTLVDIDYSIQYNGFVLYVTSVYFKSIELNATPYMGELICYKKYCKLVQCIKGMEFADKVIK